jgi:hypothetical protein
MARTQITRLIGLCSLLLGAAHGARAQELPPLRDTFADTWVATDGQGRAIPTAGDVRRPRGDRFVALFYFLWLGRHGEAGPFDISKILARNPGAIDDPLGPDWGPLRAPHHWGESIFGYYVSDDPAVLRKHAQMLSDAGVDVLVFDVTNQLTYPDSWRALLKVFDEARRDGLRVPQVAFLCPFGSPGKVVRELYDRLYAKDLYPHLWFRWNDKPLILADPAKLGGGDDAAKEIRAFFTFRIPQPSYFTGPTRRGEWGWLEVHPQHVFTDPAGRPEEMTVGVAQNAVDGKLSVLSNPRAAGRSFHDGKEPAPADRDFAGRNFAEQWTRALAVDPPIVFVTGWNEWIAGRFQHPTPFYGDGPVSFVDEFDAEFSRDIEPMKGGHGDAYYYQFVANVRRYKGARPIAPVIPKPITVDGNFADWRDVAPEFRDTIGDGVHRDHRGWGKDSRYTNQTGRNDLVATKVSFDNDNVYFYARTKDPLTPSSDANWMLLFIDADNNPKTGWLGYDVLIDHGKFRRNVAGKYEWKDAADVASRVAGDEIELAIPRKTLGIIRLPFTFDFKWADNIQQTGDASDFTLNGDAAPNDRFNYRAVLNP